MRALGSRPRPAREELAEIQEQFGVLLDEKEAASLLGATVRTLRRWREHGSGPDYIELDDDSGSVVRYPAVGLRRYLECHLVRSFTGGPIPHLAEPISASEDRAENMQATDTEDAKAKDTHQPLAELRSVKQLAEELGLCGISESSIRWTLFNAETNGLAASGAVVRPPGTRRVLIDRAKYEQWLRSGD